MCFATGIVPVNDFPDVIDLDITQQLCDVLNLSFPGVTFRDLAAITDCFDDDCTRKRNELLVVKLYEFFSQQP